MNQSKQGSAGAGQRRGFFRRAGVFMAVAAIAGTIGLQAHAQGGHGFRGGWFAGSSDPAKVDERVDRMLKHLSVEINATPEQQQKLAPIVKQAITDLQPLREQMRNTRKQATDLMSAPQIDRAAIEALRAQKMQTADAISRRMSQAMADAAEVLTPEQRKQLAERMQQRHGKGRHGMRNHG